MVDSIVEFNVIKADNTSQFLVHNFNLLHNYILCIVLFSIFIVADFLTSFKRLDADPIMKFKKRRKHVEVATDVNKM